MGSRVDRKLLASVDGLRVPEKKNPKLGLFTSKILDFNKEHYCKHCDDPD